MCRVDLENPHFKSNNQGEKGQKPLGAHVFGHAHPSPHNVNISQIYLHIQEKTPKTSLGALFLLRSCTLGHRPVELTKSVRF